MSLSANASSFAPAQPSLSSPPASGTVRLPLEIGTSSLANLTAGAALLGGGVVLLGVLLIIAGYSFQDSSSGTADDDTVKVFLGAVLAGLVMVSWGTACLRRSWRSRPSDLVLQPDGLRIDGGEHHGVSIAWSELDGTASRIDQKRGTDAIGESSWQLWLATADRSIVVAETDDPKERDSFEAVLASLRARAGQPIAAGEGAPTLELLRCPQCSAVATPDDASTTPCAHCGTAIPIPDTLRARVAAFRELPERERRIQALLRKLLNQPGASITSAWMTAGAVLILLAWPAALGAIGYQALRGNLGVGGTLLTLALPAAIIAGAFFLVRPALADRQALQLVSLDFCARPPATVGGPEGCRSCGAPLLRSEAVLVRCVYCDAENITGLDLRGRSSDAAQRAGSLQLLFEDRQSERRQWFTYALVCGVPLLLLSWGGFRLLGHPISPVTAAKGVTPPVVLTSSYVDEFRPVPDPAGHRLIAQTSDKGVVEVIPLEGGGPVRKSLGEEASFPTWAPDGEHVVYVHCAHKPDHGCELHSNTFTGASNGAAPTTLYRGGTIEAPSIGPDGALVFYENEEIVLGHLRDGQVVNPIRLGSGFHPVLSPDGTRVAYVSGKRLVIRTLGPNSPGPEETLSEDSGGGSFAPDGRRFVHRKSGEACVLEVLEPGAAPRPLLTSSEWCDPPVWFSGGIAVSAKPYGNLDVLLVRSPP